MKKLFVIYLLSVFSLPLFCQTKYNYITLEEARNKPIDSVVAIWIEYPSELGKYSPELKEFPKEIFKYRKLKVIHITLKKSFSHSHIFIDKCSPIN